jgi:hypothetical protein
MATLSETGMQALRETFAKQTEKYRETLDEKLSDLRQNSTGLGRLALVAGIVAATAIVMLRSSGKQKSKLNGSLPAVYQPKRSNPIMTIFWESIGLFLLSIARERLQGFLAEKKNPEKS